jgi:hypothetical protein
LTALRRESAIFRKRTSANTYVYKKANNEIGFEEVGTYKSSIAERKRAIPTCNNWYGMKGHSEAKCWFKHNKSNHRDYWKSSKQDWKKHQEF